MKQARRIENRIKRNMTKEQGKKLIEQQRTTKGIEKYIETHLPLVCQELRKRFEKKGDKKALQLLSKIATEHEESGYRFVAIETLKSLAAMAPNKALPELLPELKKALKDKEINNRIKAKHGIRLIAKCGNREAKKICEKEGINYSKPFD